MLRWDRNHISLTRLSLLSIGMRKKMALDFTSNKSPLRWKERLMMHSVELVLFIFVSALLAALFISVTLLIDSQKADPEKLSAYECGFDPFDDARARFDIRFFLVALLFLVFDLEVSFLFPWSVCLSSVSQSGFWSIIAFLLVLTVGFVYEWQKGALEWE